MDDGPEDFEKILDAMREQARSAADLLPSDYPAVQDSMRRIRRRRWILRTAIAVVAMGLVSGLVVLLSAQHEPDGTRPPARIAKAQPPPPAPPAPPPAPMPMFTRLEPYDGLVALVDAGACVDFPSPGRMVLTQGTAAVEIRVPVAGRGVTIETPTANIVVTGTALCVSVGPDGTGVELLRGRVEVTMRDGPTVGLRPGQMLLPGHTTPETLPSDRAARLLALFPEEQPMLSADATQPAPAPVLSPHFPKAVQEPSRPPDAHPPAQISLDETYDQAETAMRNRDYAVAADLLRKVLDGSARGGSREETALYDLADMYERLGDVAGQRDVLEKYLERHPSGAFREDTREQLCRLLERVGPSAAFESCLEEYLVEFPTGRRAGWARGMLAHEAATVVVPTGDGG